MRKCISSFATADGKVVAAGEFVEDGDPVIKGREAFFAGVSDPVKAPELGADKEGDTVPDNNAEPTRTPNVNGVNPVDPPPVDDDDPRLRKDEDSDRGDDDGDEGERLTRPPSTPRVEEATAEPGGRRASGRGSDRK